MTQALTPELYKASVKANNLKTDPYSIQDWEWQDMPSLWVPKHYDNKHWILDIEDQSIQGSCVAQAGTSIIEAYEKANTGNSVERSRRHLYWHARAMAPTTYGVDEGTTLRDAIRALYHIGSCTEATCPYDNSLVNVAPSSAADAEAANYKVTEYRRLKGVNSQDFFITLRRVQEAISTGHILLYASELEQDYFSLSGPGPHLDYMGASKPGGIRGYFHAQALTGYYWQGSTDWATLVNSWGPAWGENGTARIRLMAALSDATDIWAIKKFNGIDVTIPHSKRKKITQLYVSIFGRAPDAGGLNYWVGQLSNGVALSTIADTMFAVEPARAYYPSNFSNEQIVAAFYQNVLGRPADSEGLAYWTSVMNALGFGQTVCQIISTVETYTGSDSQARASCQLFANKVGLGQMWGESGGGVEGSDLAILA